MNPKINSENCPVLEKNLVNANVTLKVSRSGVETSFLEINFKSDSFGEFRGW